MDEHPDERSGERPPSLHVPRPPEDVPAGEMEMVRGWLEHLRESAVFKIEGVDDDQLHWRPTSTANSLGEIVVHLGYVERLWLRVVFAGEAMDMAWRHDMFSLPDDWSVADVVTFYRAETAAADRVLDRATSFDERSSGSIRKTTLRWIVLHLIEELARHVGHMDITRELIDGSTGR